MSLKANHTDPMEAAKYAMRTLKKSEVAAFGMALEDLALDLDDEQTRKKMPEPDEQGGKPTFVKSRVVSMVLEHKADIRQEIGSNPSFSDKFNKYATACKIIESVRRAYPGRSVSSFCHKFFWAVANFGVLRTKAAMQYELYRARHPHPPFLV